MAISCDLFCTVVDNLGDAGVCWRLARQLANEQQWSMRLWIDDLAPLQGLRPGIDATCERQVIDGVEICHWRRDFAASEPAQIVIEAFACELPASYLAAMAAQANRPVWINIEYLSAEDWVTGCHGMASPHPSLPLTKHFFFPGFVPGTGGLIRERHIAVPPAPTFADELSISLFCYDNPALPRLLQTWSEDSVAIHCHVADGLPRQQVAHWLGTNLEVGTEFRCGAMSLTALPFLPQAGYDALLQACHLNFVRGEDSFVRAQWAERPFVWQIYPQADAAHQAKLAAFLELHAAELDSATASAVTDFWQAWNGLGDVAATWPEFRRALPELTAHAPGWLARIRRHGDLADNLAKFCLERL